MMILRLAALLSFTALALGAPPTGVSEEGLALEIPPTNPCSSKRESAARGGKKDGVHRHASSNVGYLFTSFPVDDEAIYMHLSNGNNALSYRALSLDGTPSTQAILRSDVGTTGVRDSFIVPSQDGKKFWLIATDLKVNDFTGDFNTATRFGSRSIVVWESSNLVNWSAPRLTPALVPESAGNAWAPEAYFDPLVGSFVVVFASRFWDVANDPERTGPTPDNKLVYVTTTDFVTFSEAKDYLAPGFPVIDATFLAYPEGGKHAWIRWVKDERDFTIFQQVSRNGLLGDWTPVGDAPAEERITINAQYQNNEGPLCFRDNLDKGLFHLWIDENTQERYIPYQARTLEDMQAWQASDLTGFPQSVKHGKVLAVTQAQYDAISAGYKALPA